MNSGVLGLETFFAKVAGTLRLAGDCSLSFVRECDQTASPVIVGVENEPMWVVILPIM